VTRGRLPQRAGLPGPNGGGAAAAVPPIDITTDSTVNIRALQVTRVKCKV